MLPAHLAENIRKQVLFYLQSTFDFQDPAVGAAFERFVLAPENGIFKGPWVQLRRPFRPADQDETMEFAFSVPFHPFKHQARAWRRLDTRDGQRAKPTIVTTGTGSGKTECFLFPVLDHCNRMRQAGQVGIKAIILYPMNALAADQEKRFASMIWKSASLTNAGVTVGNYTGRYDPSDPVAGKDSGNRTMGERHGISHHETLQQSPPDILLTNYKMLDYLLIRPQDSRLWRFNEPGAGEQQLKFLVLDELHTYDGAQGADVACLIRRLKQRLGISQRELCVVGTSATLDDRSPSERSETKVATAQSADEATQSMPDTLETSQDRLAKFASTLFEEPTEDFAVIGEDRLPVADLVTLNPKSVTVPTVEACEPIPGEDSLLYVIRQASVWGGPVYDGPAISAHLSSKQDHELTADDKATVEAIEQWCVDLGHWLRDLKLFRYLLEEFDTADASGQPLTWRDVVGRLVVFDPAFAGPKRAIENETDNENASAIVASLFALIAQAKARESRSGRAFPLVPTQVQLWIRELRRLGRLVHKTPTFTWLDEPNESFPALPAFHCNHCGESGWVAVRDVSSQSDIGEAGVAGHKLISDPATIYRAYFGFKGNRSPHLVIISPWHSEAAAEVPTATASSTATDENYLQWKPQSEFSFANDVRIQPLLQPSPAHRQLEFDETNYYLCSKELVLRLGDGPCPLSGDTMRFRVLVNEKTETDAKKNLTKGVQGCPRCGEEESVFFIGSQAATLSSVAIDELFGSTLNNDPKLLAFTDSVQDASHRAGFFTSRTYSFTFRTALQHSIDAYRDFVDEPCEHGLRLSNAGRFLLDYWTQPRAGWKGGIGEAMAVLMPPDLQSYWAYLQFRNGEDGPEPPEHLRRDITERLSWEVIAGFGLNQAHGRTLEPAGSCSLRWDPGVIDLTVARLRERLPGIDTLLEQLTDDELKRWLYGFLYRARLRGAMSHPYLVEWAKQGAWGKNIMVGRRSTAPAHRETHPNFGRYRPRLMTTVLRKHHEFILSVGNADQHKTGQNWQMIWARKALSYPQVYDADLVKLLDTLLVEGTNAGLFKLVDRDGDNRVYAVSSDVAYLTPERELLKCSETNRQIVRPPEEASLLKGYPSWEFRAKSGRYVDDTFTARQLYYQRRYRKGALRRVVASEHTGLLATDQRESLERDFAAARHADDPNILTCTSTLEMGIDIGDLSSTMLCSIPPSTSSYLQRIGRAGRQTGTAFVVSIVNQRPHDLFFYGRPSEMLRGRVDPPGCWLDASAVLVRQYLAFLLDSAVAAQVLTHFPRSGRQLVDDLATDDGNIPRLLQWATTHEAELQNRFLNRFDGTVLPDTRVRFIDDSTTEILNHRIHQAAGEFAQMVRDLENARKRLQDQKAKSEGDDAEADNEIERELRILAGRLRGLSQSTALEILTDHGLLPNYAFPERGVRFYGSVYNKHHRDEERVQPVELTRPASAALRELAPANHFYTNSRKFDIQQIAIGNANQPLIQTWAICGACGHMRREEEINQPSANPACPQCGHNVGSSAQIDRGQQKRFLEFSQSQAISQMENYDSLSGDSSEERDRQLYQILRSFDLTLEAPAGAVADEELPFGIEYLGGVAMREVNVGFQGEQGAVAFGVGQEAPDVGFRICGDCGVVVTPGQNIKQVDHRRSCTTRRANDRRRQQKRSELAYPEQSTYLYRSLRSEAIRLLLPLADDEDIATLTACVHLGLRLRFDGNPAHLIVTPHVMPNTNTGTNRYYLILMDSVPGGTGYLKSLYQTVDNHGRAGEGLMSVLRLAKNALETCSCRRVQQDIEAAGASGCYRCIRAYHLQYSADQVSSDRGIELLDRLIRAGEKRKPQAELKNIKPTSLFGSMLERRFIDRLQQFIESSGGQWNETIIRGYRGYQFSTVSSNRIWEIELQPRLGMAQGVMVDCQPDFLIRCDDDQQLPIAVFTDGFEFHCWPANRLADDFLKRNAILESGNYRVWSVTWDDLDPKFAGHVVTTTPECATMAETYANLLRKRDQVIPEVRSVVAGGFEQLKAFLAYPEPDGWQSIVSFLAFFPFQQRSYQTLPTARLAQSIESWAVGNTFDAEASNDSSDGETQTVFSIGVGPHQDIVSLISQEDLLSNRHSLVTVLARLSDSDAEVTQSDYRERWRRFLAHVNQYQFVNRFQFFTTKQSKQVTVSVMPSKGKVSTHGSALSKEWAEIVREVVAPIRPWIEDLAHQAAEHSIVAPSLEYFNEQIDDDAFAEVAWPDPSQRLAILVGDQADFRKSWEDQGWKVISIKELQDLGIRYLIEHLKA